MADVNSHASNVRLVGGRRCLDFVNTVDSHKKTRPKEYLIDYAALAVWGRHAGLLGEATALELVREAERRPDAAADVLRRARELRGALYRIFSDIASQRTLQQAGAAPGARLALATLNAMLGAAPRRSQLVYDPPGFRWDWDDVVDPLEQPLWQVLWSAVDLLTTADVARVGECQGENCSWLFFDTSRAHSRRWCSMEDCGNRAKARRHYARQQRGQGSGVGGQVDNSNLS